MATAENPVFDVESSSKRVQTRSNGSTEAEAMLLEIKAAHAALTLRMRELEQVVQQGKVAAEEPTPVVAGVVATEASESDSLLVYASNAARHVFAQKVTTPACFHQVTTVILLDSEQAIPQKALFFCSSIALLLLQTMTLNAVAGGVSAPSCVHNSDCQYGSFCSLQGYCTTCLMNDGFTPRLTGAVLSSATPGDLYVWSNPAALNASQFCSSVDSMETIEGVFCQACYDDGLPGDHWNIGKSMGNRMQDAVNRMRGGDWAAMILVAAVVGLYCAGELRDIKLCQLTFEQRNGPSSPVWVRAVLFCLVALRQYSFLPNVIHIVAMLIMHRGSDAISICFNALAVLFLLDIDAALFQFWLPEKLREHMEEFGMPTIRNVDAVYLASVKRSHAVLVAFWVTMAVIAAGSGNPMGQGLTNVAFVLGGLYEAITRSQLFEEESIGRSLLNWVASCTIGTMWGFMVLLSMVGANWVIMFPEYQAENCGINSVEQQPNCIPT